MARTTGSRSQSQLKVICRPLVSIVFYQSMLTNLFTNFLATDKIVPIATVVKSVLVFG